MVRQILPTYLEADGPNVPLGTLCDIEAGGQAVQAEIVQVGRKHVTLMPFSDVRQVRSGARVIARAHGQRVPVGQALLGRAIDALGDPIDQGPKFAADAFRSLASNPGAILKRVTRKQPLTTHIRAIDGLLPLAQGQRIGIFAPSGVGKSSLINQITRQADADIVIACLVGERGREVDAFWNQAMTPETRQRATLVAATSDQSAAMRVRAGHYAIALAEYWRDQGRHVLLLLDSITRLAMAMREMGLAAGEPPTLRAYTPGVFAAIPQLVERCGAARDSGAITAIMTVLSEGEDIDDPISEMMKSILDGHIILSRALAEKGHFPAIDVPRSISRLADKVAFPQQQAQYRRVREWLSLVEGARTLVDTGFYSKGANPELDRAIEKQSALSGFLKQTEDDASSLASTLTQLGQLTGGSGG